MEQLYIGSKIIRALPASRDKFTSMRGLPPEDGEDALGYVVYYPDNYVSWSPKEVFEQAYRLVSPGEMTLITKDN